MVVAVGATIALQKGGVSSIEHFQMACQPMVVQALTPCTFPAMECGLGFEDSVLRRLIINHVDAVSIHACLIVCAICTQWASSEIVSGKGNIQEVMF